MKNHGTLVKRMQQLLVAALLCSLLFSAAVALAAPTEKQMKQKVYQVLQEQLGLGKKDVTYYDGGVYHDGNVSVWSFTLLLKECPADEDGVIVIDFSIDGTLRNVQPSQKISLAEQFEKDIVDAIPFTTDNLYALQQKWGPDLAEIEKQDTDPYSNIPNDIRVFRLAFCIPSKDDYPLEDAREKSRQVVGNLPGWTQEKLNMYRIYLEAFYDSEEVGKQIYQFVYAREDQITGKYANASDDTFIETYEKPLFALFGGDNGTTPWYVSVRIDGHTGELVEEPLIAFPPVHVRELYTLR